MLDGLENWLGQGNNWGGVVALGVLTFIVLQQIVLPIVLLAWQALVGWLRRRYGK